MCYGMCNREGPDGTCTNPHDCIVQQHIKEAESMNTTNLYCPECENSKRREWLLTDGEKYRCDHCERWYTKEELLAAYIAEAEELEADAVFVRAMLEPLAA